MHREPCEHTQSSLKVSIQARDYFAQLEKLQDKLAKLIDEVARTSETSNTYWSGIKRDMRSIYEEMRGISQAIVTDEIPAAFEQSLRDEVAALKANEFTPNPVNYKDIIGTHAVRQSLKALLDESLHTLAMGLNNGQTQLRRLLNVSQQVLVSEKALNQSIAEGYTSGGTGIRGGEFVGAESPYGAYLKTRETLLEKAQDGKYIAVVDKNGDTIMYNVDDYTRMVVRTKLSEATTSGVINAAMAVGGDLVEVSDHNTTCEVCQEYEGKVYSLSGKDEDFPPVDMLPPFHVNCEHSCTVTFREGMEVDGTLQDNIDFSNEETTEETASEEV